MIAIAFLFVCVLCDCFKSRRRLEAEILVLRHIAKLTMYPRSAMGFRIRAGVEHVFGDQKNGMGAELVRTIGIVRARCKIGMTNLVYNMRRFVCLERMAATGRSDACLYRRPKASSGRWAFRPCGTGSGGHEAVAAFKLSFKFEGSI